MRIHNIEYLHRSVFYRAKHLNKKSELVSQNYFCLKGINKALQQCCGYGIFIPDPGSEFSILDLGLKIFWFLDPDPHQRIEVFLTPQIFSMLSEIWSGMFIPDPVLDFLPIPDPGVIKAPDPGFATLLRSVSTKFFSFPFRQAVASYRSSQSLDPWFDMR